MSYTIERLTDKPVVIATFHPDFDPASELEEVILGMRNEISKENGQIYIIIDLSNYELSINDLFFGTKVAINNQDNDNREEIREKAKKTIFVTNQRILQASIAGFERFGISKSIETTESLDLALKSIH